MSETPLCPNRDCVQGRSLRQPALKMLEKDFHGTGMDIMRCPSCKRVYYVSYKVDVIMEMANEY